MWYEILCHLETFLAGRIADVTVAQGYNSSEDVPSEATVRIYRSTEDGINLWMRRGSTVTFAIDLWHGNDSIIPKDANAALADLESRVQAALIYWPKQAMQDLKMKLDIPSLTVASDGENYRPMCAAFYQMTVRWNK